MPVQYRKQSEETHGTEYGEDPVQNHSAALDRLLRQLVWVRSTAQKCQWYFKYPAPGPRKAFKGGQSLAQ